VSFPKGWRLQPQNEPKIEGTMPVTSRILTEPNDIDAPVLPFEYATHLSN